jgi:hypothetical protein
VRIAASLFCISAAALFMCACGRFEFAVIDDARIDASGDALPSGPFGAPQQVIALSHPLTDDDPTITGDGLELYFTSERGGAATGYADVYVTTRASLASGWSAPTPVIELNSTDEDQSPGITPDGLTIYFSSRRPSLIGGMSANTWVSTRPDRASPWAAPALVQEVSTTFDEFEPQPDATNTHLVFYRLIDATNREIFVATRQSAALPWGTPVLIAEINTPGIERAAFLAADGLAIWFSSDRMSTTGPGINDLYIATRAMPDEPYGTPTFIAELNTSADDDDPCLSADARIIVFTSNVTGDYEVYEARR